jgi:hypothetical protein
VIFGYPTMAKFNAYDFKNLEVRDYWHDTYSNAVIHSKSLNANDHIVIGTIVVVEVQP